MTRPRLLLPFFGLVASLLLSPTTAISQVSAQTPSVNVQDDEALANERGLFNDYSVSNHRISSYDGLTLHARLYEPDRDVFPGRLPGLIFANSWTLSEYEYEIQARRFANRGYIVLSYATRGFGGSEGSIQVAGAGDLRDVSTMIDWLEDNTRLDSSRIAMSGVSYGGGIALMALAYEPRLKTAAAMSSWGDLEAALDRNETMQKSWLDILIWSGKFLGDLDPSIDALVDNLVSRENREDTRAWAQARSPLYYLDRINAKKAPVFIQNSYLDALFPPAQIRKFYEGLQGEKRFIMDEGVHASSAIGGILGRPSELWDEVHNWMDRHLMGRMVPVQTGISFQAGKRTEHYKAFPTLAELNPGFRALNSVRRDSSGRSVIDIVGNRDSGASSGLFLVNDLIDTYTRIPVRKKIKDIDTRYGVVYQSQPLSNAVKVRGSTRVRFQLAPTNTPVSVVAYLYDVNWWGTGSLLSYSVVSMHQPKGQDTEITLDLNTTAFDVPAGHRLALVFDTVDPLYGKPYTGTYRLRFLADSAPRISLPVVR